MLKKTLIVFLALILFCGSAPASAERMTLDIGLQTETDAKHLTADLISADGKTFILSDLFPSYAVSFPFSSGFGFSDIRSAVISLIRLFRQDSSPARFEQLSFFNPVTEKGLYAGDLFDSATQLQTLTVNISDFISQVGKADHAGLLPLFDSVFDSPVSLVIRIYDSGGNQVNGITDAAQQNRRDNLAFLLLDTLKTDSLSMSAYADNDGTESL